MVRLLHFRCMILLQVFDFYCTSKLICNHRDFKDSQTTQIILRIVSMELRRLSFRENPVNPWKLRVFGNN